MAVESPKILLIKSFFLTKAIRLFLASNAFSDIGSVGRIEKKKKNLKKNLKKSRNSRPFYPWTKFFLTYLD